MILIVAIGALAASGGVGFQLGLQAGLSQQISANFDGFTPPAGGNPDPGQFRPQGGLITGGGFARPGFGLMGLGLPLTILVGILVLVLLVFLAAKALSPRPVEAAEPAKRSRKS